MMLELGVDKFNLYTEVSAYCMTFICAVESVLVIDMVITLHQCCSKKQDTVCDTA